MQLADSSCKVGELRDGLGRWSLYLSRAAEHGGRQPQELQQAKDSLSLAQNTVSQLEVGCMTGL